ncbi:MAG: TlpA disulfide reductase family protein [Rhodothermales bacterium]|nr:TlpA disulfide reductase family protein [Rhodothermales bacterium]
MLMVLAAVFPGCQPQAPAPGEGPRVGRLAPDFTGETLDGSTVQLATYRGRYVLVDFWGTWCPPCLGEIPFLKLAYAAYPRDRFDILAISVNDHPDDLRAFIEREGLEWTQVVQHELDPTRRQIVDAYQITGYPSTFLIDPEGVIVARGAILRSHNLEKTLAKFVGPPA